MAKRNNPWANLSPEEKQARVAKMLKARAKGKRSPKPVIIRPKEIEEVKVSGAAQQSPADILATLIIAVAKQLTKEQGK